jgi:uncharacterized protein YbjT (DUF2867 family)
MAPAPAAASGPASIHAVVLGATGAVGTEVVRALLQSPRFGRVTTLGRRPFALPGAPSEKQEKLVHHVVDVFDPSAYESLLDGHAAAFCTLGLGQPSKVTREELYRVDVAAAAGFASACKRRGISHFSLLTAVGANPQSRSFYLRCKGEVEEKVRAEGFPRASFFRPSMIMTPANRYGLVQAVFLAAYPCLDPLLLGPLRPFRSVKVEDLGKAMAVNAERTGSGPVPGAEILDWSAFRKVLAGT